MTVVTPVAEDLGYFIQLYEPPERANRDRMFPGVMHRSCGGVCSGYFGLLSWFKSSTPNAHSPHDLCISFGGVRRDW